MVPNHKTKKLVPPLIPSRSYIPENLDHKLKNHQKTPKKQQNRPFLINFISNTKNTILQNKHNSMDL